MQVNIKHPQHRNIMTFIDGKKIELHDFKGQTDLETAVKLVESPFGYEFDGKVVDFNKNTWTEENKKIIWNHIMPFYEGYGYVAQMMLTGLKNIGVDINVFYKSSYEYVKSDIVEDMFKDRIFDAWGIWHHFWMKPNMLPTEKKAIYTMWESTELHKDWIEQLNSANIVFVPCQQNIETFKQNGVTVPVKLIEHGVDQEFYFYREKDRTKKKFRFGTIGSLVARKNPELLIKAFQDEFYGVDDVELYIKDTVDYHDYQQTIKDDERILLNTAKVSPMEIGNILASFDVAVFPSRGEGFGLGGLQAMGVGTTCICTGWGGFKQYLHPTYNYELKYKLVDIKNFPSNNTTYSGQWAEADYEHLRQLMRYTYENRDEVYDKGRLAAEWVKEYWTWERCAQQLVEGINEYEQSCN